MSTAERNRKISQDRVFIVLECACRKEADTYASIMTHVTCDDQAVHYGGMVPYIAKATGLRPVFIRRTLNDALKAGKVLVARTAGGCSRWWPVGLWEKMQAEVRAAQGGAA